MNKYNELIELATTIGFDTEYTLGYILNNGIGYLRVKQDATTFNCIDTDFTTAVEYYNKTKSITSEIGFGDLFGLLFNYGERDYSDYSRSERYYTYDTNSLFYKLMQDIHDFCHHRYIRDSNHIQIVITESNIERIMEFLSTYHEEYEQRFNDIFSLEINASRLDDEIHTIVDKCKGTTASYDTFYTFKVYAGEGCSIGNSNLIINFSTKKGIVGDGSVCELIEGIADDYIVEHNDKGTIKIKLYDLEDDKLQDILYIINVIKMLGTHSIKFAGYYNLIDGRINSFFKIMEAL